MNIEQQRWRTSGWKRSKTFPERILLLMGILSVLFSVSALGQTQPTFFPTVAVGGQPTTFHITGTSANFASVSGAFFGTQPYWQNSVYDNQLEIYPNHALANFIMPMPPGGQGELGLYFWPGAHSSFTPSVTVLASNQVSYIRGNVRRDTTFNCSNGQPLSGQFIEVTPGPYWFGTDSTGNYEVAVPPGTYTVRIPQPPANHFPVCPGTSGYTVTLSSAGQSVNNKDFFFHQPAGFFDLTVNAVALRHRPGFNTTNYVLVENRSALSASNVTVKAILDNGVNYVSSTPNAILNQDTLTWSIPFLSGNSNMFLYFDVNTPVNSTLGNSVTYCTSVSSPSPESDPTNNNSCTTLTITGSYDPNDKQVWNANGDNADGTIAPSDTLLRYLIRFQNTGTDTAFNVSIRDTLSSFLDPSSLSVLNVSHPMGINITNGNQVEFFFPNILLPDSNVNEPLSHGLVEFTIRRAANLPLGTTIDNTAHIYFDFNAPIVTNTVSSTICLPVNLNFSFAQNFSTVSFTNSSGSLPGSFTWDFGDGSTSTAASPSHTYANPGHYLVCLYYTDTCGTHSVCEGIYVSCQAPTSSFGFQANNLSVSFTDQSSASVIGWQWDFGDGNSSSMQNPNHTYAAPGSYPVCLTVTDLCGATTFCDTVIASCLAPSAAFGVNVLGLQATFTDQTPVADNPVAWAWDFGDGNASTLQNPSHTYAGGGSFNACLVVTNDCGAQDTSCQNITLVGRAGPDALQVQLYPNPNNGRFTLEANSRESGPAWVRIYDLTGRMVHVEDLGEVAGLFRKRIELKGLASGSYFMQIEIKGRTVNRLFAIDP
jgi:uncharacterized repeat protein (TIGR01451 family)